MMVLVLGMISLAIGLSACALVSEAWDATSARNRFVLLVSSAVAVVLCVASGIGTYHAAARWVQDENAAARKEEEGAARYRAWLVRAQVDEDRATLRVPATTNVPPAHFIDRLLESGWEFDGRRESFDHFKPSRPEAADAAIITIKSILVAGDKP